MLNVISFYYILINQQMKKLLILSMFLINYIAFGQLIYGTLADKKNVSITGARIGIENTEIGDLTDSNGNFQIDFTSIDKNANIIVKVNEFEPYKIKVLDFINSNHKIILNEKVVDIEPVIIGKKKYKYKNFGTSNKNRTYCGFDSERKEKINNEYAIRIKNDNNLKIKKINVDISYFDFENTTTLIFDIQQSKDDFPDDTKSLVDETLKVSFTKDDIINNEISLDVSDKNIWTNEDFFVTVRIDDNFKGRIYFGGNIFAFSKNTYYRNFYGNWKKFSVGEPAINVDVQIEK